ncbi:MAG: succinylglutamate desuccinylase/aspartoacylase family protein [Betaproteobacteria bacterium]|nr:succinylglutamate desuccinylase/aspartoacylase family protein [Betaproteobacteria bacterium]
MTTSIRPGESPYAVELSPPDLSAHRKGNTGIDYVTTIDSGRAGPHVLINAITHGNELCGAIAVDRLFKAGVRPVRGKLTLSFANIEAFARFDRAHPHASRFVDEDFNRVWTAETLDSPRDSVELRRARQMRPIVDQADYLLDIHSMHDPHGPVMISGMLDKGIDLARRVGVPQHIVADKGHANGTRMRDYGGFGDPASPKAALLVECGQHWERAAETLAWQTVWRFLRALEVVDREAADAQIDPAPVPAQHLVRVTEALVARTADYRFADGLKGLSVVKKKGGLIATDAGEPVRAPYDDCVLIMPTLIHVKPGLTAVRIGRLEA